MTTLPGTQRPLVLLGAGGHALVLLALAVAAAAQWLANFYITATFPVLADAGLVLAYGLYAAFALASFVFVLKWVRETRGIELEDMRG